MRVSALGVAAMDDHRLFQLAGQLQLIVQDLVLDLLGAVVPVEIEPDLAHGAQAVIHGKGFTDVRKDFGVHCCPSQGWMPSTKKTSGCASK